METDPQRKTVAVCGATGRVGGAVARDLLEHGWHVRALTRKPKSEKARALAGMGAEVVKADMGEPASLREPFDGAYGVFSVQNGLKAGFDEEVRQRSEEHTSELQSPCNLVCRL